MNDCSRQNPAYRPTRYFYSNARSVFTFEKSLIINVVSSFPALPYGRSVLIPIASAVSPAPLTVLAMSDHVRIGGCLDTAFAGSIVSSAGKLWVLVGFRGGWCRSRHLGWRERAVGAERVEGACSGELTASILMPKAAWRCLRATVSLWLAAMGGW